jgi:hypothetical protein
MLQESFAEYLGLFAPENIGEKDMINSLMNRSLHLQSRKRRKASIFTAEISSRP